MTVYESIIDEFLAAWSARVDAGKSAPLTHDERLVVNIFAAWLVERYRLIKEPNVALTSNNIIDMLASLPPGVGSAFP